MFHCNKKFNVQIQPYLNKIKHVFLFLCSVVTGLPTTTKAPPPSQKWVRGKQVGGGAYIPSAPIKSLLLFIASLFIGILVEKYVALAKSEIRFRMASFSFFTLPDA